jgi:hypothetical protein
MNVLKICMANGYVGSSAGGRSGNFWEGNSKKKKGCKSKGMCFNLDLRVQSVL